LYSQYTYSLPGLKSFWEGVSYSITRKFDCALECIDKVEEYTEGVGEEEFYENTQIQDAVIRRLEIVGEAIKNIPVDFREQYPDIPWRKIAGMRDVLIHGYSGINLPRVWKVILEDLPNLKQKIHEIKEHEGWE